MFRPLMAVLHTVPAALLLAAVPTAASSGTAPRSAVLILADGMGWGHLQLWREVAALRRERPAMAAFWESGTVGVCTVRPTDALVPESAGGASSFATARAAPNRAVSWEDGKPLATILERARASGRSTGLVTTGRLTHAVPASFLAHGASRDPEAPLAEAVLASGADVLLGGGRDYFPDVLLERARRGEARVLLSRADLRRARPEGRVIGLFSADYFPYAIDRRDALEVPTLQELVSFSLERLAKDPRGFLLVVDARLIDESSHNNDAAAMAAEMAELDGAVAAALSRASGGDTLVVVSSPHDTGGPAVVSTANPMDWTEPGHLALLLGQKASFRAVMARLWERERSGQPVDGAVVKAVVGPDLAEGTRLADEDYDAVARAFRKGPKSEPFFHGPANAELARVLSPAYRVRWNTGTHTNLPVPLLAWGPDAGTFSGWLEAAEVSRRLASLLGLR